MSDLRIHYMSYEEVLSVYQKMIEQSGGGFSGIRDEGGIKMILDHVQNDDYYPSFVEKLNYIVFRFCSGHFFNDGNKRISLTLGAYFLLKNEYYWAATTFMQRMEAIVYHVAASNITQDLLLRIIEYVVSCKDFDEALKMELAEAMGANQLYTEDDCYD